MGAKCPACNKQGKEVDFNVYKCRCGIQWVEPVKKASLTPIRPGWFERNHGKLKRLFLPAGSLVFICVVVAMAMKPVVI